MIIDDSVLNDGITSKLLKQLIEKHEQGLGRYKKLKDYYLGQHEILNRQKVSKGAANNKIVCNHAKYTTDMTASYLAGNPITYSCSEEYDIEQIKDEYLEQDISSLDAEQVKAISIYGRSYELIYSDENAQPKSAIIDPCNAFVCYSNNVIKTPLLGVYYYRKYNLNGDVIGISCSVYDSSTVGIYETNKDDLIGLELIQEYPHYFDGVPLVEYVNNDDKQGDYEQLIPLIDAYNILMSDRINDKEQFVEAFLFLCGIELDTDSAKKLKEERILMGYEGAKAEYLSKVLSESDIEVLRNNLKEDIHKFSMVPDLSDDSFGNNLSGVAIKYKLMGFEQHVRNKERYLTKGLRERFRLYNNFLTVKGAMASVPNHKINIVYLHNLPANLLETSQMVNNLSSIVSTETLLGQIPFIDDAKEEAELIKAENEEKIQRETQSNINSGGFYEDSE